jgi:indole-3-glycerol phosphate synthase
LKRFAEAAHELTLDVLVEVHTADELAEVLAALGETGADAIGVNNRDLKSFDVSQEISLALVDQIPASVVRVTESGISMAEDIARLRKAGFDAFLIGESLMRQPDPGEALAALIGGAISRRSASEALAAMPNVGLDSDFEFSDESGRPLPFQDDLPKEK